MRAFLLAAAAAAILGPSPPSARAGVDPLMQRAREYAEAVKAINERHAAKPGGAKEDELGARLPADARKALEELLAAKEDPALAPALLVAAGAALDLDLEEDFARIRARLAKASPEEAAKAGILVSRPRFLLLGRDGVRPGYLEGFADLFQGILESCDRVFGFEELSKVPGKKLRVRVHLVEAIRTPPHFAPEFPYHSQVDVPVLDEERLSSPTARGQFQFYGLCHELGHVVAMWGEPRREEDFHQWADYVGNALVEELSTRRPAPPWMEGLRDFPRWKGMDRLRARVKEGAPSLGDAGGVRRALVGLHDAAGPRANGAAINLLARGDGGLRVNRVRYRSFRELRAALLEVVKDPARRKAVEGILPAR